MFSILLQTARRILNSSVLLTFLTTLIVYSIKKVHERYWCCSSTACQGKRADWILLMILLMIGYFFTFNDKDLLYLSIILKLQFLLRVRVIKE